MTNIFNRKKSDDMSTTLPSTTTIPPFQSQSFSQYQVQPIPPYNPNNNNLMINNNMTQFHTNNIQYNNNNSTQQHNSQSTDLTEILKLMKLQQQQQYNQQQQSNNNMVHNSIQVPPPQQQSASKSLVEPRQSIVQSIDSNTYATETVATNVNNPLVDGRRPSVIASNVTTTKNMKSISYAAERVIGNGSFGVVYQATVIETGEIVAIKKVLQDRRFKNRELQIMGLLDHPDVVSLKHCFYSKGDKKDSNNTPSDKTESDIYLNLVMEYVPDTIHRTIRAHTKANKFIPSLYVKVYLWQILRACNYIHTVGVCHRDIKPQNLLLNTKTHEVKMCDFGSAKQLQPSEPNVSYICSRYYRAPELVFEATDYSTAIDIWSVGCVFGEMLLGNPLFPGDSGVDQLIEIIKILGTPSKDEIHAMNPKHTTFKFPSIKSHPWNKIFRGKSGADTNAIDLLTNMLQYNPTKRINPLVALSHAYFDELREIGIKLPNGKPLPNGVFDWIDMELQQMAHTQGLASKIMGDKQAHEYKWPTSINVKW